MPELPEVEIVARSLEKLVRKRQIVASELLRPRLAPDTSPKVFSKRLNGSTINFVHRRGKHVLIDLDNSRTLITHLRMSGRFMLLDVDTENPKYTHAVLHFADGERLVFQDQRHFGLMKIVETAGLNEAREIKKLAPEPLSDDFTPTYLRSKLRSSKRTLKEFLLDQTKVCGLGNIYASEAMFLSKVNPRVRANKLSKSKTDALFMNIRRVLTDAVDFGSTLPIRPDDVGGSIYGLGNEWPWRVYDREAMPCVDCQTSIRRIVQGGRSTYYCTTCQSR